MFLKLNKPVFQKISFRLSFIFGALFIANSVLVLLVSYFLFQNSLKAKDKETLITKAKEYTLFYNKGGLSNLKDYLVEEKKSDQDSQFLVSIRNNTEDLKILKLPERKQHLEQIIQDKLNQISKTKSMSHFKIYDPEGVDPGEKDEYEVLTSKLPNGMNLYVGHNISQREDLLERYLQILISTISFTLVVGIFGGYYFSNRALAPLRNLTQTIKQLYSGNFNARVPLRNSKDELEEIGRVFNQMTAKIEKLILSMQETLDQVAHELRTPLTRLKARSELALLSHFTESEYQSVLVNNIENTTEIVNLIDTIMDISEAQAGILHLNKSTINITEALTDVVDMYSIIAEEKDILLKLEIENDFSFDADEGRFKQVMSNLVSNSIKYSNSGKTVTIVSRISESHKEVSVEDNGIGISSDDLSKIWDRLYRTEQAKIEKGLGLGLSLVQSICKAHGWKISVESTLGVGSKFKVLID